MITSIRWRLWALVFLWLAFSAPEVIALDTALIQQLAAEDSDVKLDAIAKLAASGAASAVPLLKAMQDDALRLFNGRLVIVAGSSVTDALTGESIAAPTEKLEEIVVNNRVRGVLDAALAALKLISPARDERLAAAKIVAADPEPAMLPLIKAALAKESDGEVKTLLALARALIEIKSSDVVARREAAKLLGESKNSQAKQILIALLQKNPYGSFAETDNGVRAEAQKAIQALDQSFILPQLLGALFSGLSLGSVLLLAALGLAITFGLMGIINMAHGEMLMLGAYTTYLMQTFFRAYLPQSLDWYLIAAIPAAFIVAALVGVALERSVIRFLYGRPLETLLTTWGISLMLIQLVRTLFGAQNVEVANPSWMSGGFNLGADIVLPYNRIAIILFAAIVVFIMWLFLARTRLGLYVRAVTQNRAMADCMGIPTPRVDWLTFGLGSGIAGLGGVALSQIGNVGPDLGQSYIVDSFMVVVLGGVGQLAGTIIAAVGLGEINKFLEPFAGAVLGKIFVLILIILFIQKRPQGMFALKGRVAEN
ncbi:MAG: urea ABC transporter permease subunit UrtB [Deltaproteobacteria bacterium]|nr:urea ABC transporter permease subunit UrtB [Deltaproteobacteria bacterium]